MTDIKKLLGSNIRYFRTNNNLTQGKLAEMASIATNYLGLIECGKKFPSADMIEKIASALNCDTAELFALKPLQKDWQQSILTDIERLINEKLAVLNKTTEKICAV